MGAPENVVAQGPRRVNPALSESRDQMKSNADNMYRGTVSTIAQSRVGL